MVTPMPDRDSLPLAARRAAWDRLWRILLTPPRLEPADPDETRIPLSAMLENPDQPVVGGEHDRRDQATGCRRDGSRSGHGADGKRP